MTHDQATTLEIRANGGTLQSDWLRDTYIIELGYITTFDLYHWDGVYFDPMFS